MPVFLFRLPQGHIVVASRAAHSLLLRNSTSGAAGELEGRSVLDFDEDKGSAERALTMLQTGVIEGYRRTPRLICSDGLARAADVRVTACTARPPRALALAVVLPACDKTADPIGTPLEGSGASSIIGMVDAEWRITHLSSSGDDLFAKRSREVIGQSVLGFIHDSDKPELLVALAHSVNSSHSASIRVRWCTSRDQWVYCTMLVSPLSGHQLPAFAFVLSALAGATSSDVGKLPEIEMRLRRIKHALQADSADMTRIRLPDASPANIPTDLTRREWEIVCLLLAGERVPMIARTLFLSQSTVRNHLCSVFRKTGMHSQEEMLQQLRQEVVL
jgi:DNA-binding CsgD family transcriptional regulator/PAS domain-containing protein